MAGALFRGYLEAHWVLPGWYWIIIVLVGIAGVAGVFLRRYALTLAARWQRLAVGGLHFALPLAILDLGISELRGYSLVLAFPGSILLGEVQAFFFFASSTTQALKHSTGLLVALSRERLCGALV